MVTIELGWLCSKEHVRYQPCDQQSVIVPAASEGGAIFEFILSPISLNRIASTATFSLEGMVIPRKKLLCTALVKARQDLRASIVGNDEFLFVGATFSPQALVVSIDGFADLCDDIAKLLAAIHAVEDWDDSLVTHFLFGKTVH